MDANKQRGGSSSSGEKKTVKMADAQNVSHFLELFAAQIERSDKVEFHVFLKCFRNYYTLQEAIDELIKYKLGPRDTETIYVGMLGKLKSTVQEEYHKLSLDAARERSTAQKYNLEDANTAVEFLQIFAFITQRNMEMTAHQEVFLKCFQRYLSLEETIDELRRHCNMNSNEATILFQKTMSQMKRKVKEEYQKFSFNAACERNALPHHKDDHENQKVPAKTIPQVHRVSSHSKLEDADSATDFLQILALLTQQNKEHALQQEVLLKYFQSFSSFEETIDELRRFYNMDASDATILYHRVMKRLKSNVREEYQKLCFDAAHGKKARPLASPHNKDPQEDQESQQVPTRNIPHDSQMEIVSSTSPESASTSSNVVAIMDDSKNDQTRSLSQPTDSLHHILGAMAEKMKQLLDSHSKLDDKVHMAMQHMREKSNNSEQKVNAFMIEKMKQFDDKTQRTMQKMREKSNNSEENLKAFMKDFLNNDFDRKIQKTITSRFDAIGPAIGRRVVTDVEKLVASAATATDIQTEVKKAMSQVEEHLISKIDQCISRETQNLQAVFSAGLQTESAKLLSQLASATDIRIEVEKAMSELEKHLMSKIRQCISGETQKLQADFSAGLSSCKTILEQTASAVSALSTAACLKDELGELGFLG